MYKVSAVIVLLIVAAGLIYMYDRHGLTPEDVYDRVKARLSYDKKEPPPPSPAVQRIEQWSQDLDFLEQVLTEMHPDAFRTLPRKEFEADIEELKMYVPSLQDNEVVAGVMRIVARLGDEHTSCWKPLLSMERFPIELRWFEDGLYVIGAGRNAARTIGRRLAAIGDTPVEKAAELVSVYLPHANSWDKQNHEASLLVMADLLHASGILTNRTKGRFTFMENDGTRFSLDLTPSLWTQWQPPQNPPPLYRQEHDENFWMRHLENRQLLWIKINSCTNAEGFAEFTNNAMKLIDENPIGTVVIDWRNNSGGNSAVFWPMQKGLSARTVNKGLILYGVINHGTYSSATLNAFSFRRQLPVTLYGEPTSDRPGDFGEVKTFQLPNSRLAIQYSTRVSERVEGDPDALMPDVLIRESAADYLAGRDPVFNAIESGLKNLKPAQQ
jgi:hypothetical protein